MRYLLAAFFALNMHGLRWWREYFALVIALCLTGFVGYWFFLSAPSNFKSGVFVEITEGEDLSTIARTLHRSHAIRSEFAFKALVRSQSGARSIDAGGYRFNEPVSAFTIAYRLVHGISGIPPIRITFPEGVTSVQMAELLAPTFSSTFANEFKIIAAAYEGYLFPNTYVFSSADTPESIVGTLRDTFSKAIESLHPALATSTHSLPDIVRIAAILEREAKTKEDMRIIAGILWRRIALAMPLQVDAAPETYRIQGLPRVPIANPGLVAIEAALNPYASKYLFYLTGKDGLMHYAKTFAEHQANLERYLK